MSRVPLWVLFTVLVLSILLGLAIGYWAVSVLPSAGM